MLNPRSRRYATAVLVLLLSVATFSGCSGSDQETAIIRIGSKNFTEQIIVAELMAQIIEERSPVKVERTLNLGGTALCHLALVNAEIDAYPEYTGTALLAVLKQQIPRDRSGVLPLVRQEYRDQFGVEWLEPFGFNNTYALTVRQDTARDRGWRTISDLKPEAETLKAAFTAEFAERPDGYPGLSTRYGLTFGAVREMDPGLMYSAIREHEVDVISGFATDGRIEAFRLATLDDDQQFFPPYLAAPVVRREILVRHPEVREALLALAGRVSDGDMQDMNYQVDQDKRSPAAVARDFLISRNLVRKTDS